MGAVLEKKEDNKVTLKIEISQDKFEKTIQKSYLKNRNRFNIPGFRKGKAPRKIIEMNYGEGVFYEDALNMLFPKAYEEAVEELNLEPVDNPQVDIDELEKGKSVVLKVEVTVKPEVKLGEYKGIEVEKVEYNVTDEDVNKELKSLQDMNARIVEASDREVKNGDVLTIDFEGYVDEKQFEGGTAENQSLEIGAGKFIPGFEEQLIGKKKGDLVEVNVKFPEDYFEEDLKNKDALFKVTIKEVKEKQLPKLDDEFAKDVSEFDTLEELKNSIKEKAEEKAKNKEKMERENKVLDKVEELSEIDVPEIMIENQIKNQMAQFDYRLKLQGLTLDKYFELTKTNVDDLKKQLKPNAEKIVKDELILEVISKKENINATDDEIDKELEKIAKQYKKEDVEKFKEDMKKGDLDYIKSGIIRNKTVEFLIENVKFK